MRVLVLLGIVTMLFLTSCQEQKPASGFRADTDETYGEAPDTDLPESNTPPLVDVRVPIPPEQLTRTSLVLRFPADTEERSCQLQAENCAIGLHQQTDRSLNLTIYLTGEMERDGNEWVECRATIHIPWNLASPPALPYVFAYSAPQASYATEALRHAHTETAAYLTRREDPPGQEPVYQALYPLPASADPASTYQQGEVTVEAGSMIVDGDELFVVVRGQTTARDHLGHELVMTFAVPPLVAPDGGLDGGAP